MPGSSLVLVWHIPPTHLVLHYLAARTEALCYKGFTEKHIFLNKHFFFMPTILDSTPGAQYKLFPSTSNSQFSEDFKK